MTTLNELLTEAAQWLHAAYDRPPQTPEIKDFLSRLDDGLATSPLASFTDSYMAGWKAANAFHTCEESSECTACDRDAALLAEPAASGAVPFKLSAEEVRAIRNSVEGPKGYVDGVIRKAFAWGIETALDADRAARSKREGWQWVPIEPTPEMIAAGNKKTWVFPSRDCWVSMLSAAPTTSGGE